MSTKKRHSHHSTRTRVKSEIRHLNLDEVDPREIREKPETNAFLEAKENKKRFKIEREHQKYEKYHLANRKKLKSMVELEDEYMDDFPEES
jgi:hypothetical protein